MKVLRFFLIHTVIFFMNGCGGGGTSVEPEPLKTLYFIDSPVDGVDFKCGNRMGMTESKEINGTVKSGVLQCRKGTITFSLGTFVLGSIESYKDGQEIRPQDLAHVAQDQIENKNVLKIALLLQSLNDNQNDETIFITEEIKKELKINNLTNSSIADIEEIIKTLGKTPKNLTEVKQHLIRNSSISYEDSKPTISPFETEIPTSSPAGFTIGTISINEGKSPLISLTLSGEGAENFQLNNDGTLLLLKKLNSEKEYHLKVNAENIYGNVSQTINLKFKIMDKIGIAQLDGHLSNATVKIIKLNAITNQEELVYTEQTSTTGRFNTHASELDNEIFYIFEVSGGIEINNETNSTNKGALRLISKGEWIKNANDTIRVTPLSEMQYDYVVKDIKKSYYSANNIQITLDESANVLLKDDINGDSIIDAKDIIVFNPLTQYKNLYKTLQNNTYQKITNKIVDNNMSYVKELFTSSILHSFKNIDSFKVMGSFAYVYGENYFYIYDITNQKRMGEISLIKNNTDDFADFLIEIGLLNTESGTNVSIFLDLKNNRVFLSNLNSKLIIINIEDLNKPKVLATYSIGTAQHIVNIRNNILFLSEGYLNSGTEDFYRESEIKALNIKDIENIQAVNIPNLPYFDSIDNNTGYVFSQKTCSNDNLLHITMYNLSKIELENKVSLIADHTLYSDKCNQAGYFDTLRHFYLYYPDFEEGNMFKIYGIPPDLIFLYSSLEIDVDFIINQNGNTLYVGNNSYIFFINIDDIQDPYIYKTIPFQYYTDNLEFSNDIFVTKNNIIDLKSYALASQYISLLEMNNEDTVNSLELKPFQRFSTQNP